MRMVAQIVRSAACHRGVELRIHVVDIRGYRHFNVVALPRKRGMGIYSLLLVQETVRRLYAFLRYTHRPVHYPALHLLLRITLNEVVGRVQSQFACLREVGKPFLRLVLQEIDDTPVVVRLAVVVVNAQSLRI